MERFPRPLFGLSLEVFKTRLLWRGFHTLIKGVSFSSPTDVGHHNPPPSGPNVTRSFLQSMWDPHQIHPPSGPNITRSFLQSMWDPTKSTPLRSPMLAHCLISTQRPCWHSFLSPNDVGPHQIHPLQGPTSLLAHHLMSIPFREQPPRWHIFRCLALIPFVTVQAHR